MNRLPYLLLIPLIVQVVWTSGASAFNTKRIPAGAGNPVPAADITCFPNIWNGSVTNGCTSTKYWEVDIPTEGIDNQTGPSATASVKAATAAGDIQCRFVTMSYDLTAFRFGSPVSNTLVGTAQVLSLSPYSGLAGGSAYFTCSVAPQGRLMNFTWNLW